MPNVGPYIYDVSISGFTRSSIYIYDISSLRVKPNVAGRLAVYEQTALKEIERYKSTAELQHLEQILCKIRGKWKHC